ncbi:hypothetical protein ES703_07011 [subsurface metagenome]
MGTNEKHSSISNIGRYIINLFTTKKHLEHADILFLSRYRPKKTSESDYLFDRILSSLSNKYKCAVATVNFLENHYSHQKVANYNLFDCTSFPIMTRAFFTGSIIYIKYKIMRSHIKDVDKKIFDNVFAIGNLLGWCLLDLCLGRLFRKLTPKVIVSNDDLHTKIKPIGIDTKLIIVQSASISEDIEKWRSELFQIFVNETYKSDVFCVSGPFFKSIKERFCSDSKRIVVVGQPRFDDLINIKNAQKLNKKRGITQENKLFLLWATQTHGLTADENKKNIRLMHRILSEMSDIKLIIKLHPNEDQTATSYKKLKSEFSNVEIFDGKSDLYELLSSCDVLITKNSTSVIEAAILGKKIFIVDFSGNINFGNYIKSGIADSIHKEEDLLEIVKVIYNKESQKKFTEVQKEFIYNYAYIQDGKASKRVEDLIMQMIGESKRAKKWKK